MKKLSLVMATLLVVASVNAKEKNYMDKAQEWVTNGFSFVLDKLGKAKDAVTGTQAYQTTTNFVSTKYTNYGAPYVNSAIELVAKQTPTTKCAVIAATGFVSATVVALIAKRFKTKLYKNIFSALGYSAVLAAAGYGIYTNFPDAATQQ